MRIALFASALLALGLAGSTAAADIYEPNNVQDPPNGLLVPIDSSPEIQLYTLFSQRGEAIDWRMDAHTTPNAFSPLCGFTATFMLNQAGSKFGLAWYNETGTTPTAADLHEIVPAGTPVGSMVMGATIKSDPNYTGGLVGFALEAPASEGGHFTNQAYNTVCSAPTVCNPAEPWILALMYASTVTPNAYYICFEDGSTASNGWGNDGDFNDDVFFLTGITCEGGGVPCDTGMPGICAAGLTQCGPNGTTCQQLNQPMPEKCNGVDDDCNGLVDDGPNLCPTGQVCSMGMCVASCQSGEFVCLTGKVCNAAGYCVDPACENVTCPAGEVCEAGACKGPCDGIVCPSPEVCRVGACVDPCAGVTCSSGQVCDQGVCVQSCNCQPCATSLACDMTSGQCVDPSCVGVTCIAGQHCVPGTPTGQCADDCAGAVCPAGQTCTAGQCVAVMTGSGGAGGSSVTGFVGAGGLGGAGAGTGGAGGKSGASTGSSGHAGGAGGAGGAGIGGTGSKSTCGCRVVGEDAGGRTAAWAALAALGIVAARRRRR
jgi:MYXO-CTERM domain-containing protein